jgi:hypothetical protein
VEQVIAEALRAAVATGKLRGLESVGCDVVEHREGGSSFTVAAPDGELFVVQVLRADLV